MSVTLCEKYKDGIRQKLDVNQQGMIGIKDMQKMLQDFGAPLSDSLFFALLKDSGFRMFLNATGHETQKSKKIKNLNFQKIQKYFKNNRKYGGSPLLSENNRLFFEYLLMFLVICW